MEKKIQVNAAIIIIGNEILSGRTHDTNTSTIALWLNSIGVKVQEVRLIPDMQEIIINTVNLLRKDNEYVFTTGGIGPTHDDITAESISKAFSLNYISVFFYYAYLVFWLELEKGTPVARVGWCAALSFSPGLCFKIDSFFFYC